uniref:Uncharacterized protein n=1 Tax=Rhizophora mucronata TaxID=61149 RepID=A0A2P2J4A0_RHIMU
MTARSAAGWLQKGKVNTTTWGFSSAAAVMATVFDCIGAPK